MNGDEAIKAVEFAAHAVVEPNKSKAMFGTMLRVIRDASPKFTTTPGAGSITPAEAMMRALWQTSRHGGQGGTVPETLDAARADVHAAATRSGSSTTRAAPVRSSGTRTTAARAPAA